MEIESLAKALEREHREIDAGIEAFTAEPGVREPLERAVRALRRHIYLEEEFLFPALHAAGLTARCSSCCASTGRCGRRSARWTPVPGPRCAGG